MKLADIPVAQLKAGDLESLIAQLRDPWHHAQARQAADVIAHLLSLLRRCQPIIEADAQMMADISRHAPLDPASQAQHDATDYPSEKLSRDLQALFGPR